MPGSDRLPLVASDWLDACRRMVSAQRELFERVSGIEARTEYEGIGEGGDRSLVIDCRAEDIVFDELARLHEAGASFTAISEERGEVVFGDGASTTRVVIDPIDGSLNARRMLPSFALSVAVSSGESMADVELAFVHDFGAGDEFVADHGAGALLNGSELLARGPGYGMELVGLEGAKPERLLPLIEGLAGKAYRVRGIGALAITLCYVAAARLDGMLSGRPARSVDVAAAQLIVREAGASVKFDGLELSETQLGLDARYDIVAGLDEEILGTLLDVQRSAHTQQQ
jgi:myo-inositol-1(or 4)-monophosphatase